MMNTQQRLLNLEYWGRIHVMCNAYNRQYWTNIKPQECILHYGSIWESNISHPSFEADNYKLAVAIIDDKPIFAGDKIYSKDDGVCATVLDGAFYDPKNWTLTPPKPKKKRTFDLNGKKLPCPGEDYDESALELLGEHFYFESLEDRNEVAREIIKLLDNARDKD